MNPRSLLHRTIIGYFLLGFGLLPATAGLERTQTVDLQEGWNAVYLEVDPVVSDPRELFADQPIDVVASFTSWKTGAQFVLDPSASMLRSYGWAVWYAPSRPDSFLSTLARLYGEKAYLIHTTADASLDVVGTAPPERLAWTPDAYNFVGFPVDAQLAPSFGQFFRGSPAHRHDQLYRLVEGTWRQVLDPAAERMRAGEAFWIYCRGRSDYRGPLDVATRSVLGVNVSSRAGDSVVFRNRTDHPVAFVVEHVVDPAHPIPLSSPVSAVSDESGSMGTVSMHFEAGAFTQAFPALEAGQAIRLPLDLRLQDAESGQHFSLLKVVTDLGTVAYVPVTASRDGQ